MRVVIILFAIIAGFLLLRSLLAPLVNAVVGLLQPNPPQPPVAADSSRPAGELKKDPVCGTFVSPELAVTLKSKGQTVHFCSAKCRDEYSRTA